MEIGEKIEGQGSQREKTSKRLRGKGKRKRKRKSCPLIPLVDYLALGAGGASLCRYRCSYRECPVAPSLCLITNNQ
jgi:hypothetical protein